MYFKKINTFKYFGQTEIYFSLCLRLWENKILIPWIRNSPAFLPWLFCFGTRRNFSYLFYFLFSEEKLFFIFSVFKFILDWGQEEGRRISSLTYGGFVRKFQAQGIDVNKENNSNFFVHNKELSLIAFDFCKGYPSLYVIHVSMLGIWFLWT